MKADSGRERKALWAFVVSFFLLQLVITFRHNLNWDEYYFLSHIYAFEDGRLADPFQTFHVELLRWLTWLPGSDADQIVAGRLFMMLCEAGSLFCLFRMAREFVSINNALFAVVAWCAASHALLHGASFRSDPLAGFLMMAGLTLLMCARPGWKTAGSAGLLAAIGLLVTIKSVFFLPAFLGALFWRSRINGGDSAVLRHFAVAVGVLTCAFALLWTFHAATLAVPAPSTTPEAAAHFSPSRANDILDKVFLSQALFPRSDYIVRWAAESALSLLLCVAGLFGAARRQAAPDAARTLIPILLFVAPLLSLAVYRNAFPYFFPFILLPAAIAAGPGAARMGWPMLRLTLLLAMAVPLVMRFGASWNQDQSAQREVAAVAHELFPEAVPYIDRNGMLPSFPKVGFFMSTWGTENYLDGHVETLSETIARDQPPLLILNTPILESAVAPQTQEAVPHLLRGDAKTLRNNYIPHWGPVWVAGKRLSGSSGFEILIAGTYTLECDGRRRIDGQDMACSSTSRLSEGAHDWEGGPGVLRWGRLSQASVRKPPVNPIYYGF